MVIAEMSSNGNPCRAPPSHPLGGQLARYYVSSDSLVTPLWVNPYKTRSEHNKSAFPPKLTDIGASFDHLVGQREHVVGYREIHCLCGFHIDDEQVSRRDLDGQISRFCALENPRT